MARQLRAAWAPAGARLGQDAARTTGTGPPSGASIREYDPRVWGAGYYEAGVMILELLSRGRSLSRARAFARLYVTARRCLRLWVCCLAVGRRYPRWWAFMPAAWPVAITGLSVPLWDAAAAVVSPAQNWARQ